MFDQSTILSHKFLEIFTFIFSMLTFMYQFLECILQIFMKL